MAKDKKFIVPPLLEWLRGQEDCILNTWLANALESSDGGRRYFQVHMMWKDIICFMRWLVYADPERYVRFRAELEELSKVDRPATDYNELLMRHKGEVLALWVDGLFQEMATIDLETWTNTIRSASPEHPAD